MKIICVHRFKGTIDYEMKEVHVEVTEADLTEEEMKLSVTNRNVVILRKAALMCLRGATMQGRYGDADAASWAGRIIARTTKKVDPNPGGDNGVHLGRSGADAQEGSEHPSDQVG